MGIVDNDIYANPQRVGDKVNFAANNLVLADLAFLTELFPDLIFIRADGTTLPALV